MPHHALKSNVNNILISGPATADSVTINTPTNNAKIITYNCWGDIEQMSTASVCSQQIFVRALYYENKIAICVAGRSQDAKLNKFQLFFRK